MMRGCEKGDSERIWEIINDGAQAYRGVIPVDQWAEPYMSREAMGHELDDGVVFWGFDDGGELVGVMGIQKVRDVTLIRHAYVRSEWQKRGIGARLLGHLLGLTEDPILIGTWADAVWAIRFYEKHGFQMVDLAEKDRLLKKYWKISERQRETSVVLADSNWREMKVESAQFRSSNKGPSKQVLSVALDFVSHNNSDSLLKLLLLGWADGDTLGAKSFLQGLYEAACADLRVNRRVAGGAAEVDGVPVFGD